MIAADVQLAVLLYELNVPKKFTLWQIKRRQSYSQPTQYRSFRRRPSQPITWLILTNKTVQENTDTQTQYKSETVNNLKYSTTKLPWFSRLLRHSARKRGGLILQCSQAHTGQWYVMHGIYIITLQPTKTNHLLLESEIELLVFQPHQSGSQMKWSVTHVHQNKVSW